MDGADCAFRLYLLAGGGTNTIARALKSLEEDYRNTPAWDGIYERVCRQAIIYMIITQDDTYRDYIAGAWPGVRMLHNTELAGIGFFDDTCATPDCDLRNQIKAQAKNRENLYYADVQVRGRYPQWVKNYWVCLPLCRQRQHNRSGAPQSAPVGEGVHRGARKWRSQGVAPSRLRLPL